MAKARFLPTRAALISSKQFSIGLSNIRHIGICNREIVLTHGFYWNGTTLPAMLLQSLSPVTYVPLLSYGLQLQRIMPGKYHNFLIATSIGTATDIDLSGNTN